jgi:hypothetical protein
MGRIGVAISTHKRPTVLAKALANWAANLGPADILVVNHDHDGAGVAATKNAGITALMDADCDSLFLVDDDAWPVTDQWWRPYIELSQPHACHCWGRSRYLRTEGDVSVWRWPRGPMLYAERYVIEKVGGMRLEFSDVGGEHVEHSRRIHNAGFTRHAFQDAAGARTGIWFCEDYVRRVPSSLPPSRYSKAGNEARHQLFEKFRGTDDFVNYRSDNA